MLFDIVSLFLCILIVVSYYASLTVRERRQLGHTVQAIDGQAREQWVENMMQQTVGQGVLAVQTLRNIIMATIFLASTSILPIIGILNLTMREDSLGSTLSPFHLADLFYNVGHLTTKDVAGIKLLCLLVDFFWAFFCFCLAIGMFKQVGLLISAGSRQGQIEISAHYVTQLLNSGEHYYSIGVRACFLSVPLVFWMFGPDFMLAATIGLIFCLYRIDRPPSHLPSLVVMGRTGNEPGTTVPHLAVPGRPTPFPSGEHR